MQYDPLNYHERDDKGVATWHEFDREEAAAVLADLSDTGQIHPLGQQRLLEHILDRLDELDTKAAAPEAREKRDPWDEDYVTPDGGHGPDHAESVAAGEQGSGATGNEGAHGRR